MRFNFIPILRQESLIAVIFLLFTTTVFWKSPGGLHGLLLSNKLKRTARSQSGIFDHTQFFRSCHKTCSTCSLGCNVNDDDVDQSQVLQSRESFFRCVQNGVLALTFNAANPVAKVKAFDGGVGGLGKTKPETGVKIFDEMSAPTQNDRGIVFSEIKGTDGSPILVSFQAPWPLLPTSGALEARDIRSTESAFVHVTPLSAVENTQSWKDKKRFQSLLMTSVFAAQGKFGAYGQPYDIQVKSLGESQNLIGTNDSQASLFSVTFTTLTPAMRESERKALIAARQVRDDTLVLLVVTTTNARYASNEKTFGAIASSFEAISAPQSSFSKRSSSTNQ